MYAKLELLVIVTVLLMWGSYYNLHFQGRVNLFAQLGTFKSWRSRSLLRNDTCPKAMYVHTKKISYGNESFLNESSLLREAQWPVIEEKSGVCIPFIDCLYMY